MRFFVAAGTGATGSTGSQMIDANTLTFTTNTPDAIKLRVSSGASGAVVNIDSSGAGAGGTGAQGVTGPPAVLPAAMYTMRQDVETWYRDGNILPYFTMINQPADGSIQMFDRSLAIFKSGNYLINMSVATNGTEGIPNLHLIVEDANGKRDIDVLNFMPNGMTAAPVILPITVNDPKKPAMAYWQIQGAGAGIRVPKNPPQGDLSIVKIG
jgi:hypothetical protein